MNFTIIERIGYCWAELLTLCLDPTQVIRAEVEWTETHIVQPVVVSDKITIKGKGYYRLKVWIKPDNKESNE